jgi:hypothetical protein
MPADRNEGTLVNVELAILRALISRAQSEADSPGNAELGPALRNLAGHKWWDEEHCLVYECLRTAAVRNRHVRLREEMAAEATRKGHPEVEWNLYFDSPSANTGPAELIDLLLRSNSR